MSDTTLSGLPGDRQPLQSRSRASLARMLDAARKLLVEFGSTEFSLADVSRTGRVSIGSIYHRFDSKDELLRAVHQQLMEELRLEQAAMVRRAQRRSADLPALLVNLIDEIGEFLRKNAGLLRPMMVYANKDEAIATEGAAAHMHLCDLFTQAVLGFASSMRRDDPDAAVVTCFKLTYAAIAHDLGFGDAHTPRDPKNWDRLKADLAEMCAAFLTTPPASLPRVAPPAGTRARTAGAKSVRQRAAR